MTRETSPTQETIESLRRVILRDLATLRDELGAYESEEDLWRVSGGVTNSAGNLALHLCGNLRHFFGAVLSSDDYVRDRPSEFEKRSIPREELIAEIDMTRSVVDQALNGINPSRLDDPYPQEFFGHSITTIQFLIHLSGHLTFHLGQIDYHRRLLTGGGALPDAVSIPDRAADS